MSKSATAITELVKRIPELQDQLDLLDASLHQQDDLSSDNRQWVFWATVTACKNESLAAYARESQSQPDEAVMRGVMLASSRMAVTNPYYVARNIEPLGTSGSLDGLKLRPFPELNVQNGPGYHYACIAVSTVNGGFVCFKSHLNVLRQQGESEAAIDQAMRLISVISAVRQIIFNSQHMWP